MNLNPSDHPRLVGAASLSKPGFDIVSAVASSRQAMLPTVRLLRAQAVRDAHRARVNARLEILGGRGPIGEQIAPRPVRFFELSDAANALPEIMNNLFTRGFQPMLIPSHIERNASAPPTSPDVENME